MWALDVQAKAGAATGQLGVRDTGSQIDLNL
jgi:hypothetical protein